MAKRLRPGVVAVFVNVENKLLLCKRTGQAAWQFPQGGIDAGEAPVEALYREVLEELGCNDFTVLAKLKEAIAYHFPASLQAKISEEYRGQEQFWFLCQFQDGAAPDLARASDREFDAWEWAWPAEALARIVTWKKAAYAEALEALGLLPTEA